MAPELAGREFVWPVAAQDTRAAARPLVARRSAAPD